MPRNRASAPRTVLVDAHVHFHPRFDPHRFLLAAERNLRRGTGARAGSDWVGCLVLTDAAGQDGFPRLREAVDTAGAVGREDARSEATDETHSFLVRVGSGEPALAIVAGLQIETAEGLELLAFPAADRIPEGLPLPEALRRIEAGGAVAVAPWGFGKWWMRRGHLLLRLLDAAEVPALLLADTAHRPRLFARAPRAFAVATRRSIPVLAGSDPLPLPGEEDRAGSYGFRLQTPWNRRSPAASLVGAIGALDGTPPRFGRRVGMGRFLPTQVAMQLRKRRGRGHRP